MHEVLENELAAISPKIGNELGIRYDGKHPEKGYHRYRVHRYDDELESGEIDWAKFGGHHADESPVTKTHGDAPQFIRADAATGASRAGLSVAGQRSWLTAEKTLAGDSSLGRRRSPPILTRRPHYLESHAVDLDLAHELGVRSDRDSLVYPYTTPHGDTFTRRRDKMAPVVTPARRAISATPVRS